MFLFLLLVVVAAPLNEVQHTKIIGRDRGYQVEVLMPDETRCDLVSDTHAIEVEWASKWKEAPAQATLYSIWTGKKPGILLLVKNKTTDKLNVLRCKLVCERLGIDLEIYEIKQSIASD
jgi:hypothetical protein